MAGDFLAGLGTGTVVGAASREIFKSIAGAAIKRRFDQTADKRRLVREDSTKLAESAEALVQLALKYYGKSSADGRAEADQIRSDFKTFGVRWNIVENRLKELSFSSIGSQHLIRFRQALTSNLHVERPEALSLDSSEVAAVFSAFAGISESLSALKYRAV